MVSYYLQKGHSLQYLLNLTEEEKLFFIESMVVNRQEQIEYDIKKIKASMGVGGE